MKATPNKMMRPRADSPLSAAAFILLVTFAASLSAGERPNVVILLADDLGYRDIGCYDGPVVTPALDELAARGVRFTDFHSGAAVCSPSRATLLTGRQHLRTGVYSWIADYAQNSHLLEREVTLAEILQSHGYATAHFGKWHLGLPTGERDKPTPDEHGFDYWFATGNNAQPSHRDPVNFIRNGESVGRIEGYACQIVVDEAITWLDEQRDPNEPFFLNVWFHEPHAPIAAPDEIVAGYGQGNDPAAIYSGTIDNTDRAIARLLAKLEEVDAPENTLIIYSSDNGSYRADRVGNLRGTKGSNFEGGIRVPGIFYWPGMIAEGRLEDEPAGLVDLLPTVCGLLGIDKPEGVHLDGSDLSPLLTNGDDAFNRHQPLFWLLPASGPAVAIREGNYSLVAYRDYEFPRDRETMAALMRQIEELLREKGTFEEETRGSSLQKQMFEGFNDRDAEQLRGQYIRLNMFQESWIPAIKAGTYRRFELYDLEADLAQQHDLSDELPDVAARLRRKLLEINASVMAEAPDWLESSVEARTRIHRLSATQRSPFDAFVYVNRIPENAEEGESAAEFAGRIFGRLANQEGRVLIKLPPGMDGEAYSGFKTFMRNAGESSVGNCAACHTPADFTDSLTHVVSPGESAVETPSLRNLAESNVDLRQVILDKIAASRVMQSGEADDIDAAYSHMRLEEEDVPGLVAFLKLLNDVSDSDFRNLILNVEVLNTQE